MGRENNASDQRARVRVHVRAMVNRLLRAKQASNKSGDGSDSSAQGSVKPDREQDRS